MIRIEPRNENSAIFSYGVPILSAFIALLDLVGLGRDLERGHLRRRDAGVDLHHLVG